MNDFVINLFVPPTIEGSAVAVLAHMYANENDGTVSITRCAFNDFADTKVKELLHHITVADGYNAPQPMRREIWVVNFRLSEMTRDELMWFSGYKDGRIACNIRVGNEARTLIGFASMLSNGIKSFSNYVTQLSVSDNDYALLYDMLDYDEYEHLLAYLLQKHPNAKDVIKEDYVLNMFVEHAKKARLK